MENKNKKNLWGKFEGLLGSIFLFCFWGLMAVFLISGIFEQVEAILGGDFSFLEPFYPFIILGALTFIAVKIAPNSVIVKILFGILLLMSFLLDLVRYNPF